MQSATRYVAASRVTQCVSASHIYYASRVSDVMCAHTRMHSTRKRRGVYMYVCVQSNGKLLPQQSIAIYQLDRYDRDYGVRALRDPLSTLLLRTFLLSFLPFLAAYLHTV